MLAQPGASKVGGGVEGGCCKVAFIGTHGVGKTTLTFDLATRLKRRDYRVELVREVARKCPLPLNRETTVAAQAWILHRQMALEIELAIGHEILICDRSALDNYAYLVEAQGRLEPYDTMVRHWMPSYTLLAWVPPLERPSYDGVRDLDPGYQERIHARIGELIDLFGVAALMLDPRDRDGWIPRVMAALPPRAVQLPLFEERGE